LLDNGKGNEIGKGRGFQVRGERMFDKFVDGARELANKVRGRFRDAPDFDYVPLSSNSIADSELAEAFFPDPSRWGRNAQKFLLERAREEYGLFKRQFGWADGMVYKCYNLWDRLQSRSEAVDETKKEIYCLYVCIQDNAREQQGVYLKNADRYLKLAQNLVEKQSKREERYVSRGYGNPAPFTALALVYLNMAEDLGRLPEQGVTLEEQLKAIAGLFSNSAKRAERMIKVLEEYFPEFSIPLGSFQRN